MNFGDMLNLLNSGFICARAGWNGKHMYIYKLIEENYLPTIVMKTSDDKFLKGWLASQTDIFATDWMTVTVHEVSKGKSIVLPNVSILGDDKVLEEVKGASPVDEDEIKDRYARLSNIWRSDFYE